jgi:tRNA-splicing ligase RtcB
MTMTTMTTTMDATMTPTAADAPRAYETMHVPGGVPVKSWTRGVPFEAEAKAQLARLAALPFIHKWVAAMPDVHHGKGATVGSVIATKGAIIPAAVGVDIGCGMIAVQTSLTANDLPDDLAAMRSAIEAAVPHGRTNNGGPGDRGAWHDLPAAAADAWATLAPGFEAIVGKHPSSAAASTRRTSARWAPATTSSRSASIEARCG